MSRAAPAKRGVTLDLKDADIHNILRLLADVGRVNIVTADLFRKYRKPADYLKVSSLELEKKLVGKHVY